MRCLSSLHPQYMWLTFYEGDGLICCLRVKNPTSGVEPRLPNGDDAEIHKEMKFPKTNFFIFFSPSFCRPFSKAFLSASNHKPSSLRAPQNLMKDIIKVDVLPDKECIDVYGPLSSQAPPLQLQGTVRLELLRSAKFKVLKYGQLGFYFPFFFLSM